MTACSGSPILVGREPEYSGPEKCAVGPWVTAERLGESALSVGLEFIVDQVAIAVLGLDSS